MKVYDKNHVLISFSEHSLLTRKEAAAMLGIQYQTLAKWACLGIGPKITRIGSKLIRYRVSDLQDFIKRGEAKVTPTPTQDPPSK